MALDDLMGMLAPMQGQLQDQGQQQAPATPAPPPQAMQALQAAPQQDTSAMGVSTKLTQDLLKELQNLSNPSASEQDFQKRSAYTIEQRQEDKYNRMMGISHVPIQVQAQGPKDPNNPNAADPALGGVMGDTGKTKTKIDWKRFIPATLAEMGRAFVQKAEYVPLKERLHQQAQSEYQQELGPLAREVQYDNMNRRAAYKDATSLVNNLVTNDQRKQANDIKEQAMKNSLLLGLPRAQYYTQKSAEIQARNDAGDPQARVDLMKLKAEQEKELIELTHKKGIAQGFTNEGLQATQGLKGDAGDVSTIHYWRSVGNNEKADELQKALDAKKAAAGLKNVSVQKDAQGNFVAVDKGNGTIKPIGGSGASGNSSTGNLGPDVDPLTGKPDKYRQVIQQNYPGISSYYRGAAVAPTAVNFKDDVPASTDPKLAALIHSYPIKAAPQGTEKMKNEAAMKGYSSAQELYGLLKDFSPSDLGTLKGQWTKLASEYADPGSWTKTPSDKYARFAVAAQILGANHSVTQGFRSSQFVDEIGKSLNALQTNKQVIGGKIYQFEKTFMDHLSQHPELKAGQATRNWSADQIVKAFHPEAYKTIYGRDPGPPDYGKYGQGSTKKSVSAADLMNELKGK